MLKKLPQRTCLGCRKVRPKREMIRMVRLAEGKIELDPTGRKAGRGAYVCPDMDCIRQMAKGKGLEKALGVGPSPGFISKLESHVDGIKRSSK